MLTATPVRNVLFIVSDDLRAGVASTYGDPRCKTPNIERLASQGMVFDRAYCQGVWCAPSRTSFMYSRYSGRGKVNLGEHFKNHGFYSARVGKIYHMAVPRDIIAGSHGQDRPESWTERFNSQGDEAATPGDYACLSLNIFTRKLDGRQSSGMPERAFVSVICDDDGSTQPDAKTAVKTIELLRKHRNQPFFIAAGFVRPHYPMVAPKSFFDLYPWEAMVLPAQIEGDLDDIPKLGRGMTSKISRHPDNQKRMWSAYYASVTFMDQQLGKLLDELERLGLRQSTTIVFTSDHGYHLADHSFWEKSNLHEQVTRVPLIISAPGFQPGRTDALVELVDLFPTLSDLAGLEIPAGVQGVSLVPILKDHQASVKTGAISLHERHGYAWRTQDWAYMCYQDGSEELYDMLTDPGQITNLARDPSSANPLGEMAIGLQTRLKLLGLPPQGPAKPAKK